MVFDPCIESNFMGIEETILLPEQIKEWDTFVENAPGGTVYHTSHWIRGYNSILPEGMTMKVLCCRSSSNNEIIGACTLMEKKRYGFRLAVNGIATQYAGFLFPPPPGEKISSTISRNHAALQELSAYLHRRYHETHLQSAPGVFDFRPLQHRGWEVAPAYTYYVDISEPQKTREAFDGSVRRQIKKAEKHEFNIVDTFSPGDFIALIEDTFRRQNQANPIPADLIRRVVGHEDFKEHRLLLGAIDLSGTLKAGIVALKDTRRAYYTFSATGSDMRGSGIQSLLLWELFNRLHDIGVTEFDFLGANIPSIARFKEKFNAEPKVYYSVFQRHSLILGVLKNVRQLIKR